MNIFFHKYKFFIFLIIILLIACFFRFWQLKNLPPYLFPDVAMNANDALETLKTGNFKVFYPENNGREGLMMWLVAMSFSIFGVSVLSLKIVAAVIGVLTILGLYLLTKELFKYENFKNNEILALLSAFFLAISFWHVNFSRLGFRAILLPFVLVFGFYFLYKGLKDKKIIYLLIAGIFFGLGFYTYISYRFIVILLFLILIPWLLLYLKQKEIKKFLLFIFCFLAIIIIVALPIGFYFLKNPQYFANRATPISIFATENPAKEFFKSLILHLGMFNFYGDPNWRHNLATSPQLNFPLSILFLIGFIVSLKNLISAIKNKDYFLLSVHSLLIFWFFIFLLPGILTYEGIPHCLRVIGVIPAVFIFSGFGAWKFYEFLNQNTKNKKLLILVCFFFLFSLAVFEYNKYFNLWGKNDKLKEAFGKKYYDIGVFLNSLPEDYKKYVIIDTPNNPVYGISIDAQTPMFIESTKFGKPQSEYIKISEIKNIDYPQNKIIIVPLYEDGVFEKIIEYFPWAQIKTIKDIKYLDLSY